MNLHLTQSGVVTSTISFITYFLQSKSMKSCLLREYPFMYSSLNYKAYWINIVCNYVLPLFSKHICLCILIVHIYPCLYFFGRSKAHSLYRCDGSCISLLFIHSSSSFCISGNNTLLVISVSFSICSGNMSLANSVCIASCVVLRIYSQFKSFVSHILELGHRWCLLYSLSLFHIKVLPLDIKA